MTHFGKRNCFFIAILKSSFNCFHENVYELRCSNVLPYNVGIIRFWFATF